MQLGEFAGDVQNVAKSIATGLKGHINQPQLTAAKDLLSKYQALQETIQAFEELAGVALPDYESDFLSFLATQMDALENSRSLFRDWSSWCSVRNRAIAIGLRAIGRGSRKWCSFP